MGFVVQVHWGTWSRPTKHIPTHLPRESLCKNLTQQSSKQTWGHLLLEPKNEAPQYMSPIVSLPCGRSDGRTRATAPLNHRGKDGVLYMWLGRPGESVNHMIWGRNRGLAKNWARIGRTATARGLSQSRLKAVHWNPFKTTYIYLFSYFN